MLPKDKTTASKSSADSQQRPVTFLQFSSLPAGILVSGVDNKKLSYDASVSPMTDNSVIWVTRDITERKQAEELLRQSEILNRSLVEHLPHRIFVKDRNSAYLFCNSNYAVDLGIGPKEIVGKDDFAFFSPALAETYRADDREVMASGKSKDIEERYALAGEERWIHTYKVPYRNEQGETIGVLGLFEDITERKLAEAQRELLAALVEASPDFIGYADPRTRQIQYINKHGRGMCGIGEDEDVGKLKISDVHPAWMNKRFADVVLPTAVRDGLWEGEGAFLHRNGREIPVSMALLARKAANGEVDLFYTVSRDITERKTAEEALRKSEHRYRSLFANMIEGYAYCRMLFDHDKPRDFIYLEVNGNFEHLTGLKDVAGKSVSEVIPGFQETSSEVMEIYGRVALTGKPERVETYVESLGIWFSIAVYSPAKDHFIAVFDNITERKQAEVALRERIDLQGQIAQIAAASPGVLYSFRARPDGSQCFPYASPAIEDLFGVQARDLEKDASEVFGRIHPEDIDNFQASITESARTFSLWSEEFRFLHPRRGQIWVMASSVPQREAEGSILWRGFAMDITERKRTEADVVRLAAAVEQTADSIVITDPKGNIQYVNPAFERITGYAREDVLGQNPRILKSGQTGPAVYKELWETITRGEVWRGRLTNRKKDKTLFEERVAISPVHDKTDRIVNYIAVKQDISDLTKLEDQLRQSQKMEAVGQLAGGIAHDFNNLLTAINGYSSLALRRLDGDHPIKSYLEEIKKAGDRAANLTRQLLAFGRKQMLQPVALNLNSVVSDMNKMLCRLIGEDIKLTAKFDPALRQIKADPGQIEQVLVNLVVNARDAMPQGGDLSIETANFEMGPDYVSGHVGAQPGNYVMLAISDTGTGMDEATKTRIFEPFFTTKEKGKGTGLGLSTVYGIVKQSGGYVWVDSEPGHGTSFKIYLPQQEMAIDPVERKSSQSPVAGGSETILLVEDDDVVRGLAGEVLASFGYEILGAANGEDAINLSQNHAGPIHLLLTDVVMPNTSGKDLADQLKLIRPSTRVLFMSGYTDEAIVHHGIVDADVQFIQKPFSPTALARKVREVLELKDVTDLIG